MSNVSFAVQGLRSGEWITLFAPLEPAAARTRMRELMKANPACRYRVRWVGLSEPIVEQR